MQGLDPKVIVFKYKKKKHYRRNIGHRQVLQLFFYLCNPIVYQYPVAIKMSLYVAWEWSGIYS